MPASPSVVMEDDAIFVLEILHCRWQSFYTWKAQFYADMWAGRNQGAPHPQEDWSEPEGLWNGEGGEDEGLWDGGSFTVKEYGANSDSPRTFNLGVEKFEVDQSLLPLPQYTTCASTSGSHRVDDDPDILHFIPFSDDDAFDHEGHSKKFRFFAWQELEDPDVEAVCIRVIQDLQRHYGMTLEDIQRTGVMPSRFMDEVVLGKFRGTKRDYPQGPLEGPLDLQASDERPEPTATQQLEHLIRNFCPNRNCLVLNCKIHGVDGGFPLSLPAQPNEKTALTVEEECGRGCFSLGELTNKMMDWTEDEEGVMGLILASDPEVLPCDLAVILRKPCNEAAIYKQRWLDSRTEESNFRTMPKRKAKKITFNDDDPYTFTPTGFCSHLGPCSRLTNCPCALGKGHCTGACKCLRGTCPLQWEGCNCALSQAAEETCGTETCPCFRSHRECDPESCKACWKSEDTAQVCRNAALQRGVYKTCEVKRGRWGWGFFLLEDARPGELITEYIGELIDVKTSDLREPVGDHLGRSYLFSLNSMWVVDAMTQGNESRFINHATGKRMNAISRTSLVNGDHRIGIYAYREISVGEEVFMDYGPAFFKAHPVDKKLLERKKGKGKSKSKSKRKSKAKKDKMDVDIPGRSSPSDVVLGVDRGAESNLNFNMGGVRNVVDVIMDEDIVAVSNSGAKSAGCVSRYDVQERGVRRQVDSPLDIIMEDAQDSGSEYQPSEIDSNGGW